jgi:hypothetical protein
MHFRIPAAQRAAPALLSQPANTIYGIAPELQQLRLLQLFNLAEKSVSICPALE